MRLVTASPPSFSANSVASVQASAPCTPPPNTTAGRFARPIRATASATNEATGAERRKGACIARVSMPILISSSFQSASKMSCGIINATGPGRGEVATRKAVRIRSGRAALEGTSQLSLVMVLKKESWSKP